MKNITVNIEVEATKAKVWDLLFNRFGEINAFHPGLEGSHHVSGKQGEVGCERQCDFNPSTQYREKIVSAQTEKTFDVEVYGFKMMEKLMATFDMESISPTRTKVSITMKMKSNPSFIAYIMAIPMKKKIFTVLIGLKYYLETGKEVKKSDVKNIMNAYKNIGTTNVFQ